MEQLLTTYRFSFIALILALLLFATGISLGLLGGPELLIKTGPLILLLAFSAEYSLLQHQHKTINIMMSRLGKHGDLVLEQFEMLKPFPQIQKAAHTAVTMGILTWGFGDLIQLV